VSFDVERIYALLPAIYRSRDADQGYPLKGLLSLIAEQVEVIEEDLDQLYDDQFIETCAEWVVPYIGDLIGARGVYGLTPSTFSQRAQVANTIGYRRRKGTAAVLEALARDVTGWNALVVEFFNLLAATQYMNHIRPGMGGTQDMGDWETLERLGTAFESSAHTIDVRRIDSGRGRYNIPNIGIFLWRIRSYPLTMVQAARLDDHRFFFNPLGINTQLYSRPKAELGMGQLAEPSNIPLPLGRRVLAEHLSDYYGSPGSFHLKLNNNDVTINEIEICNLSDLPGDVWAHGPGDKHRVDPVLGRIVLKKDEDSTSPEPEVCASFYYGFCADIGGGEYERENSFTGKPDACGVWDVVAVHSPKCSSETPGPGVHPDIGSALNALTSCGVVEIKDSSTYAEAPAIILPLNTVKEIRGANKCRPLIDLSQGNQGREMAITGSKGSEISLNGLVISGGGVKVIGDVKKVRLTHCTLVPERRLDPGGEPLEADQPSLIIESEGTEVEIDRCITGGIRVKDSTQVVLRNSIIDASSETGEAYRSPDSSPSGGGSGSPPPGGSLETENCTIIGKVRASGMNLVSNTIFLAALKAGDEWESPVWSDRRQEGCVRFSYLPPGSRVPRRYMCQPDLAERAGEEKLHAEAGLTLPGPGPDEIATAREAERIRVRPQMTSVRYGDPGYCQLGKMCAIEIKTGADDESEMGAFHDLYQPRRETNLRMRLEEYLRFGLEAGIFYES
jgi:hypothetical protein